MSIGCKKLCLAILIPLFGIIFFSCSSDDDQINVPVVDEIVLQAATPSEVSVLINREISLAVITDHVDSYSWQDTDGNILGTDSLLNEVSFEESGIYTITLKAMNEMDEASIDFTIEVFDYSSGILILNEGVFGTPSYAGSMSFYQDEMIFNEVFRFQNDGDSIPEVPNSLAVAGDYYVVVENGAGKVHVLDRKNLTLVETFDGFFSPRDVLAIADNKVYVTDWGAFSPGSASVSELDLDAMTISEVVGGLSGAEAMTLSGEQLYVSGTFLADSVFVINTVQGQLTGAFALPNTAANPQKMVVVGQDLWVTTSGNFADLGSGLVRISLSDGTGEVAVSETSGSGIVEAGGKLYFNQSAGFSAYDLSTGNAATLLDQTLYGFDVGDGQIVGSIVTAFDGPATGKVYDLLGNERASFALGINPGVVRIVP